MVPWAHPSLHPTQHLDWFSRFCTAHRRVSHYFTMGRYIFPQNCPFPRGNWCCPLLVLCCLDVPVSLINLQCCYMWSVICCCNWAFIYVFFFCWKHSRRVCVMKNCLNWSDMKEASVEAPATAMHLSIKQVNSYHLVSKPRLGWHTMP